jgi:hypothetical protein
MNSKPRRGAQVVRDESAVKLTPDQRRQIEKLAPHIDRAADTDIDFFKKHPDRKHRVRLASEAEIAEAEIVEGKLLQGPEGYRWFAIVRKLPGCRLRVFVAAPAWAQVGLDVPEDVAAAVFQGAAPSGVREIEAALQAAFDGGAK